MLSLEASRISVKAVNTKSETSKQNKDTEGYVSKRGKLYSKSKGNIPEEELVVEALESKGISKVFINRFIHSILALLVLDPFFWTFISSFCIVKT